MRRIGLLTTLWTALLLFPASSFSLGLGEIEVSTFLNQPLEARIEVLSARPGEIDDLLVSLASREAFDRAGLDRPADLAKLKFTVEKSEDGQTAQILVTTKTPVVEPFLNFLVEADWAKGRLLREFTVLLDPPHFAQQPAPTSEPEQPAQAPVAPTPAPRANIPPQPRPLAELIDPEPSAEQDSSLTPIASSGSAAPASRESSMSAPSAGSATGGFDTITVGKGDTLWSIASQFKDDAHSMAQVMLAMQAVNPEAFGNDNINNLKVGSVLRAPDTAALNNLSKQQAYAQVLEQNGLWDDYLARKSGKTSSGSPLMTDVDGGSSSAGSESRLSLVAPGDGDSTTASFQNDVNSQEAGQIRKKLALAEEELEASRLQNEDLKSRISDLEQQLEKFKELNKLVEIQDSSLANLQQSVAEDAATPETSTVMDEPISVADTEAPSSATTEPDAAGAPAQDAMTDSMAENEPAMPMPAQDESEPAAEAQAPTVEGPSQDSITETIPKKEEFGPAPIIVTEPAASGSDSLLDLVPSLSGLMADPIMLAGLGGVVVLLLALLLLRRKKSAEESAPETASETSSDTLLEMPDDTALIDDDATPVHIPTTEVGQVESGGGAQLGDTAVLDAVDSATDEEDQFGATAILQAAELPESASEDDQDDVLNEIDVYLAYGLYDNAEDLLKESLENAPDRADYRAKLLDTYFATKNASAFALEAEALKSLGGAAERYWARVQTMGYELDASNPLFAGGKDSDLSVADLEYAKPDTADFDVGGGDDDLDVTGTDFDFGADSELDDLSGDQPSAAAIDNDNDNELMGDFDLPDLDEVDLDSADLDGTGDELDLSSTLGDIESESADIDLSDSLEDEGIDTEDSLEFDLPKDLDLSANEEGGDATQNFDVTGELDIDLELDEVDVELGDSAQPADAEPSVESDELLVDESDDIDLMLGELGDVAETPDAEPESDAIEIEESEVDLTADSDDLNVADLESELVAAPVDTSSGEDTMMIDVELDDVTDFSIGESDAEEAQDSTAEINIDDLDDVVSGDDADIDLGDMGNLDGLSDSELTSTDSADAEIAIESSETALQPSGADTELTSEPADETPDFESTMASLDSTLGEPGEMQLDADDELSANSNLVDNDLQDLDVDLGAESLDEQDELDTSDLQDLGDLNDLSDVDIDMGDIDSIDSLDEGDALSDDDLANVDIDLLANEVDMETGFEKTGTFPPGDFADDDDDGNDKTYSSLTDVDNIEDLMLPDDVDEVSTKLDLARAFIEMGDPEGARSSLEEVLEEGNDDQQAEARELLDSMS